MKKATQRNHFHPGCNISIQLQIEKSSLIDHYGRRAASLQAGAHLNRKNQISLWRCWNDINFPNQTQTALVTYNSVTLRLQVRGKN